MKKLLCICLVACILCGCLVACNDGGAGNTGGGDKKQCGDRKDQIERAIKCVKCELGERERQIIVMRYGLFGLDRSYTQREIAQRLNISRSYVSRIEKSALDKLYEKLKQ